MKNTMILVVVLLFVEAAFGRTSAAELSLDCDALKAKGSAVYSIDRNSTLGFCLGYLNAVFDSLADNPDIEVMKDFIVGNKIEPFQRYAPQHHAEPADRAIVNALIADGILKRSRKQP
jgi:hypothetical protein